MAWLLYFVIVISPGDTWHSFPFDRGPALLLLFCLLATMMDSLWPTHETERDGEESVLALDAFCGV